MANKARFKLPRNNHYFCSRNTIGDLVEAGLPDIIGDVYISDNVVVNNSSSNPKIRSASGTFSKTSVTRNNSYVPTTVAQGTYDAGFDFKASRSSSIYGNSDTVQPLSVSCYLEFYVN